MGQHIHIVETKVQSFINRYGAEQLLDWLDEYDRMFDSRQYGLFRKLQKETCTIYSISIYDSINSSKDECTDARRIISFIASNDLKINPKDIARLLGNKTVRTINNYINDSIHRIDNNNHFRSFFNSYNVILEKIKANVRTNQTEQ